MNYQTAGENSTYRTANNNNRDINDISGLANINELYEIAKNKLRIRSNIMNSTSRNKKQSSLIKGMTLEDKILAGYYRTSSNAL